MKKLNKIFIALTMVIAIFTLKANASTAAANGAMSTAKTDSGSLIYTGTIIKAKDGTELFCVESAKGYPNGNSYTAKEVKTNQGMWNLIRYGKSINANWAEISTAVHTYLAELKGSSSYKIYSGPTIKTSYAKQNSKVSKMVAFGKSHNKLESVTINKTSIKTIWNGTKKMNVVNNIVASGFSGNYSLVGVPNGVTFYKNNTNTKVNINSIPVGTVLELRATPNIDITNAKISVKPLTATQEVGIYWNAVSSNYQDLAQLGRKDPLTPVSFTLNSTKALVNFKVLKDMNDIDMYEQDIIVNDKPYYKTKDGNAVAYKLEDGSISISTKLKNPSKEDFDNGTVEYSKPYKYKFLAYENLTVEQDRLDVDGNKIPIVDENGNQPKVDDGTGTLIDNPVWIPTYEKEMVNIIDQESGLPLVKQLKDNDGNPIYDESTTPFNLGSEKELLNIYKAQKNNNVEFTLYKADRTTVVKSLIVENGEVVFTGLNPNETYYIKETKTDEAKGFILDTTWYKAIATPGQSLTINNGKVIENQINYALVTASKRNATGETELEGAHLMLIDEHDNIVGEGISKNGEDLEFRVKPGNYSIKEEIAPIGYEKVTILIPVIIKENGEVVHVDVKNELIKASMKIDKIDITTSKELPGANLCITSKDKKEFTITVDNADKVVKSYCWTSTTKTKEFILYYGNYELTETIAPKGYNKLKTVIPFNITQSGVKPIKVPNEAIKYIRTGGLTILDLIKPKSVLY